MGEGERLDHSLGKKRQCVEVYTMLYSHLNVYYQSFHNAHQKHAMLRYDNHAEGESFVRSAFIGDTIISVRLECRVTVW